MDESVTIISATELGKDFSKEGKEIQNRKLVFQYGLATDLPGGFVRKSGDGAKKDAQGAY